jgi:hypothetical protein
MQTPISNNILVLPKISKKNLPYKKHKLSKVKKNLTLELDKCVITNITFSENDSIGNFETLPILNSGFLTPEKNKIKFVIPWAPLKNNQKNIFLESFDSF